MMTLVEKKSKKNVKSNTPKRQMTPSLDSIPCCVTDSVTQSLNEELISTYPTPQNAV